MQKILSTLLFVGLTLMAVCTILYVRIQWGSNLGGFALIAAGYVAYAIDDMFNNNLPMTA